MAALLYAQEEDTGRMKDPITLLGYLIVIAAVYRWLRQRQLMRRMREKKAVKAARKPQVLKPKSECDCPVCREGEMRKAPVEREQPPAWSTCKGKGGPKKKVSTQGQACWNPECVYFGIVDEKIHALVGCGGHGKKEWIQDLKCQACKMKFTIRKNTVMYRLKKGTGEVEIVVHLLGLGVDPSALEQVFGIRESTIRTWQARCGMHSQKLHERFMTGLNPVHVQLDELWANTKNEGQALWVWVVTDAQTKLIPVLQVGGRTQDMAYRVVHELKHRLRPGCVPVFSSDGLKHYFYALTAHFGRWERPEGKKRVWTLLGEFAYAQVIKHQRRHRTVEVERRLLWGNGVNFRDRLKAAGLSGRINTAFVERVNLTIRQCVSKLTRRTWGPAHFAPELVEHLEWWRCYYHFIRYHESLATKLPQPENGRGRQRLYRRRTPAMAAGLTSRRWTVREFLLYPLP